METLCFGIEAKQPKQTVSKQTEKNEKNEKNGKIRKKRKKNFKNRKNSTFSVKSTKYAPYQTVSVGLLFVSVQSKHPNSLFRYTVEAKQPKQTFCFG
jgi:hypothetical protein